MAFAGSSCLEELFTSLQGIDWFEVADGGFKKMTPYFGKPVPGSMPSPTDEIVDPLHGIQPVPPVSRTVLEPNLTDKFLEARFRDIFCNQHGHLQRCSSGMTVSLLVRFKKGGS